MKLAKADSKTVTAYILDKTIFAETMENEQEDNARADDNNRIDNDLYRILMEQIINLQKIIYNKDSKLLEYSQKNVGNYVFRLERSLFIRKLHYLKYKIYELLTYIFILTRK